MIRLFIVDDHYVVIEGVHAMLKDEPTIEWMGHATNAESCLYFLKNHKPDVVLMDISMPGQTGMELCKQVLALYPEMAVLAFSTFSLGSYVEQMLDLGAAGYVLKTASKEELLLAIHEAARGKSFLSYEAARIIKRKQESGIVLSRREKEVLSLISEGLTNAEIAERLFLGLTTVISHRKNILEKFKVSNTALLIRKAMECGFID